MLSENLRVLRTKKNWTQKEFAEKLHVTPQAVSRWENGEVEPSISTINEMAKIFEITVDELIRDGKDENLLAQDNQEVLAKNNNELDKKEPEETDNQTQQSIKPVLTICENCKRPIYNSEEIVSVKHRHRHHISTSYICLDCDNKLKAEKLDGAIKYGISQRKKSFIWGIIISLCVLGLCLIGIITDKTLDTGTKVIMMFLPVFTFTFASCLFLKNNFIENLFLNIASFGFVKLPGIIFSFDLDGLIWFICVKLLLFILGIILAFGTTLIALIISLIMSVFVYPFALQKNIKNPQLSEKFV